MILNIDSLDNPGLPHEIDLYSLIVYSDKVDDEDSAFTALILKVAEWALEIGASLDDVYPLHIEENGDELDIDSRDEWIEKVAKFAYFICSSMPASEAEEKYYAYVNYAGWSNCDFDDLKAEVDRADIEYYDGNPEAYAKAYVDEVDQGIPDHLERYFDYAEYGKDLLSDEYIEEWGGKQFIFSQ